MMQSLLHQDASNTFIYGQSSDQPTESQYSMHMFFDLRM
jgi:hypothetical protein